MNILTLASAAHPGRINQLRIETNITMYIYMINMMVQKMTSSVKVILRLSIHSGR